MSEKTHDEQALYKVQEHFLPVYRHLFYFVILHPVSTLPGHFVRVRLLHRSNSQEQVFQPGQEVAEAGWPG